MSRILINHFSPIPNKITGISVYTWQIVSALLRHGKNEYVLSTNWDREHLPELITGTGMEVVTRQVPANETAALFRNTLDLPPLMARLGCSAVFHPQPTSMIARMKKSVVVIHDLYRVTHPDLHSWKQRVQWHYFTAFGFRQAGALIAVSGATRDAVVAAYPEVAPRTFVVHEASPVERPTDAPPRAPATPPYGLMVANITPNKNVKLLIQALGLLAQKGIRPKVNLVGRDEFGVLPSLLSSVPSLDLHQLGAVPDDRLRELYAQATVYINTSFVEGFCLPILEAHTFSTPVICSDLPVLREVAGDGALFVDPHRPDDLAEAIRRVFSDGALAAQLSEAATRNAARFSWEKAARETEAVLDRVIAAQE
ncbi:glycosyltransferase family 4 protein [Xanthobacter autotrophicus]|uniref:glycosyltransferase family 4 protein n=1 Tax=Xanthobacter autotrophicus TaxID=280 RepID=UPI0037291B71